MGVYDRQIATAKRLITAKGRKCVWRAIDNEDPADVDKPWKPGAVESEDHDVNIVFLPDTRSQVEFLQALTGTDINVGDDYGLMPAVDFVPTLRAEVYDETGTTQLRSVKSIEPLAPNGDVIMYTLRFGVET